MDIDCLQGGRVGNRSQSIDAAGLRQNVGGSSRGMSKADIYTLTQFLMYLYTTPQ